MYAIVEIKGHQYKVEKGQKIFTEKIDLKEGETLEIDKVMIYRTEKDIIVGLPYISNVKVIAKVLRTFKGPKILGMKYKNKTNYRRLYGHRQWITELLIEDIRVSGMGENKMKEIEEDIKKEG